MNHWLRKNAATLLAIAGIGIGLFATVQASALSRKPASPTAVAVVDWVAVTNKADEWKELLAQMKKLTDDLQQENGQKQKEIKDLNDGVAVLPEGSENRQREQTKLNLAKYEYDAWQKYAENSLQTENIRVRVHLYNKILAAIGKVAERDGWQIVLWDDTRTNPATETDLESAANLMSRRQVLYSRAEAVDITDEVTLLLNNEFRAGR